MCSFFHFQSKCSFQNFHTSLKGVLHDKISLKNGFWPQFFAIVVDTWYTYLRYDLLSWTTLLREAIGNLYLIHRYHEANSNLRYHLLQ